MKHAIILAAGKGTRMNSDLPKCAHMVLGKPMINHIVDACKDAGIDDIIVIIGFKREVIMDLLKNEPKVRFAFQEEQLGTGHAVMCAKELLDNEDGNTVILPGDMPLIGKENINKLIKIHLENHYAMTILTALFDNPFSYGRIVRDSKSITRLVEEKEATDEEKLIKEVNTGLYVVDNKMLFDSLSKINNNNAKGEYYLTDIVGIISKNNIVGSLIGNYDYHLMGINDIPTLNKVEMLAQK